MSLLLDALKKAEKAKDDAKRRAQMAGGSDVDESNQQVRTRNELPDISRPLDINADDEGSASGSSSAVPDAFSTAPAKRQAPEIPRAPTARDPDSEPAPRPRQPVQHVESAPDPQAAQKLSAKKVFEAKFREPNPKLPFYITMAVLGLFSVGTVIYFWYQLRPPPPLINTDPKPASEEKRTVPPSSQTATTPAASANPAPVIPGLPSQGGQPTAPAQAIPGPAGAGAIAPAIAARPAAPAATLAQPAVIAPKPGADSVVPRETTRVPGRATGSPPRNQGGAAGPAQRAPADPSNLSINRRGPVVDPRVETAWDAYNQGDMATSRSNYLAMLRVDPMNRDALLGMAAVEIRSNRPEQASGYYQSLLQANPRDTHAQAGLLALRAQLSDPIQTESRVKSLLASDPDAQVLYFTLGNQYAHQGRWPEAQQAYFKAYTAEPENPDFAYNLAVSLDQIRQPKVALEYYRRALSLAQQRASSFDQSLARNRAQELSR